MLIRVATSSLLSRRLTAALTLLLIAISTFVLLGVEHIQREARDSFNKTVSGTDLIVGARTGQINLLLYSVFHIGNASNNISWQSYTEIATLPGVAWTIPVSLGDSHRGYRVMGTNEDYFRHFRFGDGQPLTLEVGEAFQNVREAVVGWEVAANLNYAVGDNITLSHGTGAVSFSNHDEHPFVITGILAPSGTPVDRLVLVSLESLEAIHLNWPGGGWQTGVGFAPEDLEPESVTAMFVGLESRLATFALQRRINEYREEPLLAILPGVALTELWGMTGALEQVLRLISLLVLVTSLLGMSIMLLSSMAQRRREIAILRALGAHASFVFLLVEVEALLLAMSGVLLGTVALMGALAVAGDWLGAEYGLFINTSLFTRSTGMLVAGIVGGAILLALIPAVLAYRDSRNQNCLPG